jgi:hypothetical protein
MLIFIQLKLYHIVYFVKKSKQCEKAGKLHPPRALRGGNPIWYWLLVGRATREITLSACSDALLYSLSNGNDRFLTKKVKALGSGIGNSGAISNGGEIHAKRD